MNSQRPELDRFDRAILLALQHEGRIANSALAERVHMSESACLRRVRALEESGLISGYTALINQELAGCPVNVFVNITLIVRIRPTCMLLRKPCARFPK